MLAATWVLAGSTTMIALLGVLAAVLGLAAPERLGTIFVQVRESYNRAIRARDLAYLVTDVGKCHCLRTARQRRLSSLDSNRLDRRGVHGRWHQHVLLTR